MDNLAESLFLNWRRIFLVLFLEMIYPFSSVLNSNQMLKGFHRMKNRSSELGIFSGLFEKSFKS